MTAMFVHCGHGYGKAVTSTLAGKPAHMPSDVTPQVSFFDRFAQKASGFFSKPWFFAMCLLLVLVWAPSFFIIRSVDTWQLIINTATTIVTFLMVALLQNSQTRANKATQDKLNAIADGLADLMLSVARDDPTLIDDLKELRDAVGLEDRESA
jgi:low affinity Fe/Cu permease